MISTIAQSLLDFHTSQPFYNRRSEISSIGHQAQSYLDPQANDPIFTLRWCWPCFPQNYRGRVWSGFGKEAVAAGEDGEECDAQYGARGPGENGGCCKSFPYPKVSRTILRSRKATTIDLG